MKILAIFPSYSSSLYKGQVGGGEISNRLLFEELSRRGCEITVSVPYTNESRERITKTTKILPAITKKNILSQKILRLCSFLKWKKHSRQIAKNLSPDIIISTTYGIPIANDIAREFKVPSIAFVRAYENFFDSQHLSAFECLVIKFKKALLGNFGREALTAANSIVTNSFFMEEMIRKVIQKEEIFTVYPPIVPKPCSQKRSEEIRTLTMIGTSRKKGIDTFIGVAKEFPRLDFRIIGSKAINKDIPQNVSIEGWVNAFAEFKNNSDAVIVPSTWEEPFGRVAVEAVQSGCIVIASDIGGLPESLNFEPELLVSGTGVQVWVDRINKMIKDPKPFWEAASRAYSNSMRFSLKDQADNLEAFLYQCRNSYEASLPKTAPDPQKPIEKRYKARL